MTAGEPDGRPIGPRPTRVLVTGAAGQVGAELVRARPRPGVTVVGLTRAQLDIGDADAVARAVDTHAPDVVVNAAAYTAVDRAETEPELAQRVNAEGVGHLASVVEHAGARLIHISTDYVFDGTKDGWYVETDPIAPIGVYGTSKAAGEDEARRATRHVILRTAWVYGALGANFVATMRRLGAERNELGIVDDQVGCPSAAADIATAILDLVELQPTDGDNADQPDGCAEVTGTFHLASPTDTTWYGLARAALADRIAEGLTLQPITTAEYPTPAARPANSRLDSTAIHRRAGIRLPAWQDSLPGVVAELDT